MRLCMQLKQRRPCCPLCLPGNQTAPIVATTMTGATKRCGLSVFVQSIACAHGLGCAQDWGEQLEGVRNPRIFVASFPAGTIRPVLGGPDGWDDFSAGMPVFTPDGKSIVYIGWNNAPYRKGVALQSVRVRQCV